ncbi:unnamed protein product, partial [Prorocentrum cordatum]
MSAREALDGSQALTDSASARAASGGRSTSPCSERSGGRERQRRGTGTSSCRLARELEGLSLAELRAKATQSDKDIKDYARSLCKKKWTEEVKRKQRIEEAISELESAGPDGSWISASSDPEYATAMRLKAGSIVEVRCYDDDGGDQGTVMLRLEGDEKVGDTIQARHMAASDDYYAHWAAGQETVGQYHFCCGRQARRRVTDVTAHIETFREPSSADLGKCGLKWIKGPAAKAVEKILKEEEVQTEVVQELMRWVSGMLPGREAEHLRNFIRYVDHRGSDVQLWAGHAVPRNLEELDIRASEFIDRLWAEGEPEGWAIDFASGLKRLVPRARKALVVTGFFLNSWRWTVSRSRASPFTPLIVKGLAGMIPGLEQSNADMFEFDCYVGPSYQHNQSATTINAHHVHHAEAGALDLRGQKARARAGRMSRPAVQTCPTDALGAVFLFKSALPGEQAAADGPDNDSARAPCEAQAEAGNKAAFALTPRRQALDIATQEGRKRLQPKPKKVPDARLPICIEAFMVREFGMDNMYMSTVKYYMAAPPTDKRHCVRLRMSWNMGVKLCSSMLENSEVAEVLPRWSELLQTTTMAPVTATNTSSTALDAAKFTADQRTCHDTSGWTDGNSNCAGPGCTPTGYTCGAYAAQKWCYQGHEVQIPSVAGSDLNQPTRNCCACGGGSFATERFQAAGMDSTLCSMHTGCVGQEGSCCPGPNGTHQECCLSEPVCEDTPGWANG